MHMVVGFILASLLRQKKRIRMRLPSIRGKLELVHALPGRMRLTSPLLENIQTKTRKRIGDELVKIDGIQSVNINPHSGSLLIVYDAFQIKDFVVHGIIIKALGLEKDLERSPDGRLTREIALIGRSLNQQIYQSSGGLVDLKSSMMIMVLMLALYRIIIQGDRTLPSGINLLWWTYILAQRGK